MKRITLATAALLAVSAAVAQDGWKSPKNISATIVERYTGQPEKKLSLVQSEAGIAYKTDYAIDGELAGVPRIELMSRQGVFTWLEGKPGYVLQLTAPTSLDAGEFFVRPRFSRADLEFNLQGIEKALAKKVLAGKNEKIAGRETLVLKVLDKADSGSTDYQMLWVDKETGLTMKQQDWFAGKMTYEREISSIDFKGGDSSSYTIASGAKIIRGIVAPSTLLRVENLGSLSGFQGDIAKINQSVKAPGQPWALGLDSAADFGYAGTTAREVRSMNIALPGSNSNSQGQGRNQRRRNQMGGRDAVGDGNVMIFRREGGGTANGGQVQMVRVEVSPDGSRRVEVQQALPPEMVQQGAETAANQAETSGSSGQNGANASKTYPLAQSDFVDAASGDTLTLLQIKGRPVEAYLSSLVLGNPEDLKDSRLDTAKFYKATAPFAAQVLTWKRGETRFALVSTRLSKEQLVELASKAKQF